MTNHRTMRLALLRRHLRRAVLPTVPGLLTVLTACSTTPPEDDPDAVGALGFELTIEGLELETISIRVDGDSLTSPRERALPAQSPGASISFSERGLPPGSYSVALSGIPKDDPATDVDESELSCAGFRDGIVVRSGEVTEVDDLILTCTLDGGEVFVGGGIRVDAETDIVTDEPCRDVADSFFVGPLKTSVGAPVNIVATAVPGSSVQVSVNGGTLSADGKRLTCPALSGQVTVTAQFESAEGCQQTLSEIVRCERPAQFALGEGTPQLLTAIAGGTQSFLGVAFDSQGNFYAVGPSAEGTASTADRSTAVAKFLPDGALDTSFGTGGFAIINISPGGNEQFRAIAIQLVDDTEYVVVAGTAPVNPAAPSPANAEQDVALARFTLAGSLDSSFGESGVARVNFNTGVAGVTSSGAATWLGNESLWSIQATADGKLVTHGSARSREFTADANGAAVPRTDTDWLTARFNADGSLDETFGEGGQRTLDIGKANVSARSATVLSDGSIVSVGYATSTALGVSTQQPVLYKLTPAGEFDSTFATADQWTAPGVFHDFVVKPPLRAEAYGAAQQGSAFVTLGYGPTIGTGTGSDFIALRFTGDGAFDTTFGTNGATYVDGEGKSDNGRTTVILPDGQVLAVGGGARNDGSADPPYDGIVALLSEGGLPVAEFGEKGRRLYDFGGEDDFLWGAALSPDGSQVVLVGLAGTGAATQGAILQLPIIPKQ